MIRLLISFCLLCILAPQVGMAQAIATFSYQRGAITIQRNNPPIIPPLPWQDTQTVALPAPPKELNVDIRSYETLTRQEGWIDLSGLTHDQGALFIYDKPQQASIKRLSFYAPLDVVWINAEGKITSIAPNLILANITQPLNSTEPSKAILLLSGGVCKTEQIAPGDMVINPDFFTPATPVLRLPKPVVQ